MVEDSPFVYQPLSSAQTRSFRLLRLLQNSQEDANIECELDHYSLDTFREYEAVSYTWEDPSLTTPTPPPSILLHGHMHNVTANLELALRQLRLPNEDRVIWVDAICIDQNSIPEKNQQVPLMRDIYCYAKRILVWLGEERTAKAALSFFEKMDKGSEAVNIVSLFRGWEAEWTAANDLFSRHWFTRAWIVQEVVHSGEVLVHIGNLSPIPIDDLCSKWKQYQHLRNVKVGFENTQRESLIAETNTADSAKLSYGLWIRTGGRVEDIRDTIPYYREIARNPVRTDTDITLGTYPPRLGALLMRTREQLASNPLDKIYSFIGIAPGYDIPVDYTMSKGDLYTFVTRQLLKNVLLVLLWIESPDRTVPSKDADLPSWVPDFTTRQTFVSRALHSTFTYFHADSNFPTLPPDTQEPRLLDSPQSKILVVRGIRVGVVTWQQDARFTDDDDLEGEDNISLIRYACDLKTPDLNSASLATALYSQELKLASTFHDTSWAPVHTTVGDIIIVTPKCSLPLVLRPTEDREYLFVGACWLIDSRVQDVSNLHFGEDSGFSRIMYDGVCGQIDRSADVENFRIR